ncbi:MAG: queuosine precursor transporter [Defluviitaleaceae bacterium]|nr:queuosine precursor transporter [Defluviitaleaceae bacterium]
MDRKYTLMAMLFTTCFVVANILAFKLVAIFGFVFPVAVFAFLLAFCITDVVTEVWGPKAAQTLVFGGFAANVTAVLLIRFAIALPPADFWTHQEAFGLVIGSVPRIIVAGMVTSLVSKTLNIYVFEQIRKKTGEKHLWLRNNGSSFVAQLVDTAMFQLLAFFGVYEIGELATMILTTFCIKMLLDLLKTPLVYLGVWYCKIGATHERGN